METNALARRASRRAARGYTSESYSEVQEDVRGSVLDSEPIPLGHRQTIRKYFELIRPEGGSPAAPAKGDATAPAKGEPTTAEK